MKKLSRVYLCSLWALNSVSGDKDVSLPPGAGREPLTWEIDSCFPGDREESQKILLVPIVSQVTLIQSNQYATLVYFGEACPDPHQDQFPALIRTPVIWISPP